MKLRIVLCCLIGAIAAAPNSPTTDEHYDAIVVGVGSAGATAAATLAQGGRRVLALEAQRRAGGRVHTVPFGDGLVELGAESTHGNKNNRVFRLATAYNITLIPEPSNMDSYRSDGGNSYQVLIEELMKSYMETTHVTTDPPQPLGTYVEQKLTEYLTDKKPDVLKDQDFITEFLAFLELYTELFKRVNNWNDLTTNGQEEEPGGYVGVSWHRNGFKTFFEIMLNEYNGGPGVPNLDIKLNTEVTLIQTPQHPNEKVVVQCKDGSSYQADQVIVTLSLGVLKEKHLSLFSPPLPKDKQTAIEKLSMGVLDKLILSFEKPWWPENTNVAGFIWKGADKKLVGHKDRWITKIFGSSRPLGSSNTLTLWTVGEVAKEVETLPEDEVKSKCVELLQRFVGNRLNVTVPEPTGFIRSTWYSNPYTRGSYSTNSPPPPQYPEARAWLGAPLTDSSGAPRVLFAGEATSIDRPGSAHGASETGYREAMRLLAR